VRKKRITLLCLQENGKRNEVHPKQARGKEGRKGGMPKGGGKLLKTLQR